jgi:serine phosphatase RsbU (regulator of sigma subunit)
MITKKEQKASWTQRIVGSLGLRVLIVCSVFLVGPLLLHTLIIYRQEYHLKMRELFLDLATIGKNRARLLEEAIALRLGILDLIALSLSEKSETERTSLLKQIKEKERLETLVYLANGLDRENDVFLGEGPLTGIKQLYISKTYPFGTLLLGISAQTVIDDLGRFKDVRYPFRLSLIDQEDIIFVQEGAKITKESLQIFTPETIETGLAHIQTNRDRIGLKIPVRGSSFFLLIDVPQNAVLEIERHEFFSRVFSLFLIILILGGGGTIWLTRRMAKPLKALSLAMERVGEGDLEVRFHRDFMGFEINLLGKNFNQMVESLIKNMEEAKNERVARELLAHELKIGYEIQKTILPKEMPIIPGLDLASGFLAAQEVAGDCYDLFYKKERNRLIFSIADASGKGVSACLYSLCVRSFLRSFSSSCDDLSEIIRLTNQLFCEDTKETGTFVTAWIASLDLKTLSLHYSSCGHPPALLKRKGGTIEELSTANVPLGIMPFEEIISSSIQLVPGDLLLIYTDGLIEAHNAEMHLFGKARLLEAMHHAPQASSTELVHYFLKRVSLFEKGAPQFDDLTLVVIQIL